MSLRLSASNFFDADMGPTECTKFLFVNVAYFIVGNFGLTLMPTTSPMKTLTSFALTFDFYNSSPRRSADVRSRWRMFGL